MYRCPEGEIELNLLSFVSQNQLQAIQDFAVENGYAVRAFQPAENKNTRFRVLLPAPGRRIDVRSPWGD